MRKPILIVDDDMYIGNMPEEAFTKEGCRVSRAYSGTEAQLALSGVKPDLVLLDLMLLGLNGEDVFPQIKRTPVISASNEPNGRACTDSWRMPRGSIPRCLQRFKFHAPLLAAGLLTVISANFKSKSC